MSDKKEDYFDMSKAYDELANNSHSTTDKISSTAKLIGKGFFNLAKFAVKEVAPAINKEVLKKNIRDSEYLLGKENLPTEKKESIKKIHETSKERLATIEEKETQREAEKNKRDEEHRRIEEHEKYLRAKSVITERDERSESYERSVRIERPETDITLNSPSEKKLGLIGSIRKIISRFKRNKNESDDLKKQLRSRLEERQKKLDDFKKEMRNRFK